MRFSRKESGFSLLELVVVIALFFVFAGVLLERMLFYEAYVERVHFDLTTRQMQSALRMRVAELMINKQAVDYGRIAAENPMDWLEKKPSGYVESLDGNNAGNLSDGEWGFDSTRHQVLYRPRLDGEFDGLLGNQGLVRLGLFFRYTAQGSRNGLDLRVETPDRKS
jgi:type II secretory pathway pseudopilin PulG